MTRAAKYKRISDDREGRELGVTRQDADLDALAARLGLTVAPDNDYTDNDVGASASSRKARPDYERMIQDALLGRFDVILAYTSSRLTRRPREHEDLIDLARQCGITYQFVRSPSFDLNTADGRQVARMLAAADAAEAERTGERVQAAARQRAEHRKHHGGPRHYGLSAKGAGVVEAEAAEIRAWYPHVLAGGSLGSLRAGLARRSVPTATGAPWRVDVIRKIMLNPRNAGLRILHGVEYPAPNPAIVAVDTWRAVRSILENPARRTTDAGPARRHLGAGLFRCQRCEAPVNISYTSGRRLYRCAQCWRSWKADPINEWVTELVAGILAKEDARERLLPEPAPGVDLDALYAEEAEVRANLAALATRFALAKPATQAALQVGLDAGEQRLEEIGQALAGSHRTDPLGELLRAADPVAAWRALSDVSRRQAVVRALMTVTLGAPLRGNSKWSAEKFIHIEPKTRK